MSFMIIIYINNRRYSDFLGLICSAFLHIITTSYVDRMRPIDAALLIAAHGGTRSDLSIFLHAAVSQGTWEASE